MFKKVNRTKIYIKKQKTKPWHENYVIFLHLSFFRCFFKKKFLSLNLVVTDGTPQWCDGAVTSVLSSPGVLIRVGIKGLTSLQKIFRFQIMPRHC